MRYISLVLVFVTVVVFSGCTTAPEVKEPKVIYKEKIVIQEKECPKQKACEQCKICKKVKSCVQKIVYKDYEKVVFGELEEVYFPSFKISLPARIDTGATTSSIHAQNIVAFERDGKKWVRFEMLDKDKNIIKIKRLIKKSIKVKRHLEKAQSRYVVQMRLNISSISKFIDVSLTDRDEYKFPVLIGRNYLNGNAFVDVSKKYTKKPTMEN